MNVLLLFLLLGITGVESILNKCYGKAQCCRIYKVGIMLEHKFVDRLDNCHFENPYCITTYCCKDDGDDRVLTYYSCHASDNPKLCGEYIAMLLSREFCQEKTGSSANDCEASRNEDPNSFEQKYGGYKCKDCNISGKYAGNKDFPVDLPAAKFEIFVPFNISGIGSDCADIVHSSFIIVIGIALLAIIGTLFCGQVLV